uniref:CSON007953 protein n=1 Tax=Culicoides sonorensis TaxID=179676 RepID=A0A336LK73_CULSO
MESTTSNSRGFTYEIRLCILCFLRGYTQNLRNFRLLHEVKIAGKFDDIIFDEGDETYTLIQLKHKDKEGKILSSNLFSEKYNTDYNLIKYVKALNETNSHENFANKIKRAYLFTNIPFGVDDENKLLVNNNSKTWFDEIKSIQLNEVELAPNHIIEYLEEVHKTGKYFTFDDENIIKVLKTQSQDPKINVQFTDDELREALKLIVYAVGQPNVQELENIIKAEMRKSFHIEDVNTIYDKLERLMSEWFQSNNRFLQDDNSNENRKEKQFYLTYSDAEMFFQNKNENYVNYCLELVADSKTTIRPYFLFTTRDKKCLPEYLPGLDLDVLDQIDAEHLIKNGLKNLNYTQNDIEKLAKVLRYIPLELHKGIAYINTRNHNKSNEPYTIVDYLHDIEKKRLSLSNFLKTYDIDEISLVTWNITFGSIKNGIDGDTILNLLQILAYLYPKDVNPQMFLKMFDNNYERVERALDMLQNYELVKITFNEYGIKMVEILPVVQEVLQLNFEHVEEDILEQAITIINPQLVNEYLKSRKFVNKVEHNSSYYDVLENCTLNQVLHIKNLRYYIKRKPKLEGKYLKLCDDVCNKNFIITILQDDVNQLALFEKSEDFLREFLQDNVEELFKRRCNKVIQYCIQIRVLMVDGVSSNVNKSNLYLAAKYENLGLLKTIIQSGANTNRILEMDPVLNIFQRNLDVYLLLLPKIKFLDVIEVIDSKLIINLLTENFDTITSHHENLTMKSIDGLTLLHILIYLACNFFVNILVKLYDDLNVADTDGKTPLHYAVQKSNFEIIELLVRNNADINCPNNYGNTALHQAVRNKNFTVVKFLVANSANINIQNSDGLSPLYEAVASKNFEVVKYLVEKSADVNLQNNDGWTPLYEAVASKNFEVVKYLVEKSADVNLQNNEGSTPLYEAVSGKNFEIVKYLVENSANVNISNRQGLTPLYEAVAGKNFEVVKFLVENFANVNHPNNDGETPLYEAVSGKNYEVVRYLVENKANLNFPKNNGWTPLYEAVAGKNFEVVRYLVEKLADVNLQNKRGCTPLFEAVTGNNLEVVKYLVQQGANINFQNKNGCTPLFEAVAGKNFEVVEYLLDNSANVNIKNNDGVTPLFEAVASKNFEIVEFLVNKGAKINVKNNKKKTPLLEAITGNNFEIVEFLVKKGADINDWRPLFTAVTESSFAIIEVLINHGAQVNIQNNENKTLLSTAITRDNFEIVEFLVRKKADLNFQYDDGSTPLLEAVLQKNFAIVEVIVKHGANVNHQNRDGLTPLLNAVAVNSFEIAEVLVNHEANVNIQNNDGQTPLSIAIKNNNVEIIEFLRKHKAH